MTNKRFSEEDLERLVLGNEPENQELARLAEALRNWQADFTRTPTEEAVTAFAARAAEIVTRTKPDAVAQAAATAVPSRSRLRTLKYKLVGGMAAVLMLSGMTGVAVASDAAAPGDTLYGIDRALESVGFGDGGILERFEEAQVLNERGNSTEALSHAAEAITNAGQGDDDLEEALAGIDEAIAALNEEVSGEDGEVRARVAEMLSWMSGPGAQMLNDTETEPGEFGRTVADWAHRISKNDPAGAAEDSGNDAEESGQRGAGGGSGPPDDVPKGPPDNVPSNRP